MKSRQHDIEQKFTSGRRWLCALAVLGMVAGATSLQAAPGRANPQAAAQSKPAAPAQAGPPARICPDGQPAVKQMTPFGPMDVCAPTAPAAANPPAAAPQAPAATEPKPAEANKPDNVTVTTGAPQKPAPQPATTTPEPAPKPAAAPAASANGDATRAGIKEGDNAIQLNLENADLYQVLRILGPELKINTIIDPAVKGTVTINTSTTVSRKDLFGLLEMILEINGATAVRQPNGYYAIVPLGSAKQEPLDFHYAKQSEHTPSPEEGFTLKVVGMKFMPAAEMANILKPFMSPAGQIVVQDKGNMLLITESAAKLSQLDEIINVFDDPVLGRQRVRIFRVTNNLATNLVPELKSVFAGYGLTSGSTAIQFIPIERLNSILVVSPSTEVFKEVDSWIEKLDQPNQEVGMRNYVYQVQNAKASDLAEIMDDLYGISSALPGMAPGASAAGPAISKSALTGTVNPENPALTMGPMTGGPAPAAQQRPATANPAAQGVSGAGMQANVRFMPDDRNNALIIQATPHDYEMIQHTLRDMDVLPRQVLIDARIYEVNLTGDLSFGLQAFLDKKDNLQPISTSGSFAGTSPSLAVQTFAILHNTYELQLFLNASENRSRVKTLSAPSILVTNNTAARIQVGSEVPVPIGSSLTPVTNGGNSIFAQTIQFRDTGVILNVTPRINASGVIMMDIAQEVSSAQPNSTSGIVAPVISKSQFQTTAMLKDGQTLALGGIITTSNGVTKNRIPLIGDIPGIGALFGNTSVNNARRELVLVITPHVAMDLNQATGISNDFVNSLKDLRKDVKKFSQPK